MTPVCLLDVFSKFHLILLKFDEKFLIELFDIVDAAVNLRSPVLVHLAPVCLPGNLINHEKEALAVRGETIEPLSVDVARESRLRKGHGLENKFFEEEDELIHYALLDPGADVPFGF